ncbi:MAG: hypothetical protein ACK4OO_00010 [bacterium]
MLEHLNTLIDTLAHDHRRGAAEIVEDIGELFLKIAETGMEGESEAERLFFRAVKSLVKSQPSMAPVLNIVNRACLVYESCNRDWSEFQKRITALMNKRRETVQSMINHSDELPPAPRCLITYSNSSTVAALIAHRYKQGMIKSVLLSEARPVCEGLILAKKLVAEGVDVTLLTDAALMSHIGDADAVWVGGDYLGENGLVNKVGSYALAMLAERVGIPFISLIATDKVLSPQLRTFFKCLPQNPREVLGEEVKGMKVINEYYEEIPLSLVTWVFTEFGLKKPQEILQQSYDESVSELLIKLTGS